MKNMKVKAIAEGAVCAALTVLFSVISMYVPFLAVVSFFFAGAPIIYISVKCGSKAAIVSAAAAALVLFIVTGDIFSAAMSSVLNILPGLTAGFCIGHKRSYRRTLFAVSVSIMFGLLLELIVINAVGGGKGVETIIDGAVDNVRNAVDAALDKLPASGGIKPDEMQKIANNVLKQIKEMIFLYMPTFVISVSAVLGYIILAAGIFVLSRFRVKSIQYIPFRAFHASRGLCFAAALLFLISSFATDSTIYTAAVKNLSALMLAYVGVCGFSLVDFSVSKRIRSGYLRFCIYFGVFVLTYLLSGFLIHGLIILGMIDGMFNFRRLYKAGE